MNNHGPHRNEGGFTNSFLILLTLAVLGYLVYHHFQYQGALDSVKARAASPYQEPAQQVALADAAEKATPPAKEPPEGLYTAPVHVAESDRVSGEVALTIRAAHQFVAHLKILGDDEPMFEGDASGTWSVKGQTLFLDATSGDARGLLGGRYVVSGQRPTGGFALTYAENGAFIFRTPAEIAADAKADAAFQAEMDSHFTSGADLITFGLLRPGAAAKVAKWLPLIALLVLAPLLLSRLKVRR